MGRVLFLPAMMSLVGLLGSSSFSLDIVLKTIAHGSRCNSSTAFWDKSITRGMLPPGKNIMHSKPLHCRLKKNKIHIKFEEETHRMIPCQTLQSDSP